MPDSQGFDQTSNSTLAKLIEVDSELANQEAQLRSQLESVQEKRTSLRTVISMFPKADARATALVEEPAQTPPDETDKELEVGSENLAPLPLETSKVTATASSQKEAADTQPEETKKTAPSPASRNQNKKFTQKAKAAKRASGWQQYVREEFSNASLPEAVSLVLQRGANRVFEIPTVVNTIFVDELPNEIESKVRRQVTNILADGARKNKWYRGQLGQYSMSRAAAKTNIA